MRATAALALLAIAGCGNGGRSSDLGSAPDMTVAADCPNDLPKSCPSPAPSWDGGVQALIDDKCGGCHKPGGLAFDKPFGTYADVYGYRGLMLDQVYSCYMPPPDAGQLDPAQRQELLGWFVCGAPNN